MAARAVGRHGGTVAPRQTVITFEERLHAIIGQIVLRVQSLGSMAAAANLFGNRHAAFQGLDLVFGVAVRTRGRPPLPGSNGLAMDTLLPIARFLLVTLTARLRLTRKIDRRDR